ncbi:MAG: hypothetical protein H7230_02130 [Candidatus Parcubacteria bacterium]|nr:hypothetical protein [Candidatus Paceibacterota bacterium]
MPTPNTNTNANNPNHNPALDPNDPYSTLDAEQLSIAQEIPRDPESDIIAKAMKYYNTEGVGTLTPPPIDKSNIPQIQTPNENLYNHDYNEGVNPQAEAQLNKLYQQPAINNLGTVTATSDILLNPTQPLTPAPQQINPVPVDPSLVYESVTYPQANFEDYKSIYNPSQPNLDTGIIPNSGISQVDGTYVDSTLIDPTAPGLDLKDDAHAGDIPTESKSRRWLFALIALVLVLLFVGLGAYAWWSASQRKAGVNPQSTSSISVSSSSQNGDSMGTSEPTRSARSVVVVFNDPNGPKPADVAKKDTLETLTPDFLKQNFEPVKVVQEKCADNSICGLDADPDKDGLTNIQEQAYRTNPNKADSDDDGIADGDEVNIYNTDPTKSDSTNSGYSDFAKIKACNDPAFKFTNTTNKLSAQRQKQLTDNITKFQLHEPTIGSLKNLKATDVDLKNGTLEESCSPVNIKL